MSCRRLKVYTEKSIHRSPHYAKLSTDQRHALRVVAQVLPFRVNEYVLDELIDWSCIPEDPIFQLTFMQREMLEKDDFDAVSRALEVGDRARLDHVVSAVRKKLNPHPAGQMSANVPELDCEKVAGIQHKYRETCLVFPSQGQTCHAYCTFCFRWPQFVGLDDLKFATDESRRFQAYIREHSELSDVLLTGGDPMVMSSRRLRTYVEPLLAPEFEHIRTIRIGTKSLSYWPRRYLSDPDADDVLRLFEQVVEAGKHLALMSHWNHWRELEPDAAVDAVRRVRATGAQIRTQSPIIRHVNDDAAVWSRLWQKQVQLGCIPYYMFIERDTGAKRYFSLPLVRAWQIYQGAIQRVSGLARTVRGPSMSCYPGKVCVEGLAQFPGEKVFVLTLLQARDPTLVKRPFFAKFDPHARWLDDLEPPFWESSFPFEKPRSMRPQGVRILPFAQRRTRTGA